MLTVLYDLICVLLTPVAWAAKLTAAAAVLLAPALAAELLCRLFF